MPDLRRSLRWFIETLALAGAVFAAAQVGLLLHHEGRTHSPVWANDGIALAALVLRGRQLWPGVFLGSLAAALPWRGSLGVVTAICAANALQAVVGATLVRWRVGPGKVMSRMRDAVFVLPVAVLAVTWIGPTLGALAEQLSATWSWSALGGSVLPWWAASATGVLVAFPPAIAWADAEREAWPWRRIAEGLAVLALIIVVSLAVFGGLLGEGAKEDSLAYAPAPIMAWALFRFGQRGATTGMLFLAVIAIGATVQGHGPFDEGSYSGTIVLLQVYLLVSAFTALFLATAIGERQRTHDELTANRELLTSILDNTTAVVYVKDLRGRYILINRQFEELFHVTAAAAVGKTDFENFPAEFAAAFTANDRRVAEARTSMLWEEVAPQDDGVHHYVSVKFPIYDGRGRMIAIAGISTDVTALKTAQAQLKAERKMLEDTITAHERDRKLLAYELHDGLLQQLAAAGLHIQAVKPYQTTLPPPCQRACETVGEILRDALAEGRRVMSGLRPPVLDDGGIIYAIEYLIDEQTADGKLDVEFLHKTEFGRLDALFEATVFRIAQEALTNIRRHSGADRAQIRLHQVKNRLHLEIRDFGRGFDPRSVPQERFGLRGIRERAQIFGGYAEIDAGPGKGTTIFVDLPIPERAPAANS